MTPHVMKDVKDENGKVLKSFENKQWLTAMNPQTAGVMRQAMIGVVQGYRYGRSHRRRRHRRQDGHRPARHQSGHLGSLVHLLRGQARQPSSVAVAVLVEASRVPAKAPAAASPPRSPRSSCRRCSRFKGNPYGLRPVSTLRSLMSDNTVFNGRYELHRRLARAVCRRVPRARSAPRPTRGRQGAVPEFATDPSFVERFRREAQSAANLNHPNIVSVYDWGQEQGTYFIVMEYIEGRSLAEILERRVHCIPSAPRGGRPTSPPRWLRASQWRRTPRREAGQRADLAERPGEGG